MLICENKNKGEIITMNIKIKIINVLCFVFISIIALFALGLLEVPEAVSESKLIQAIVGTRIPTEKDLEDLEQSFTELLNYLERNEVVKDEIATTYVAVTASPVCSIANRNFNMLAEQYEEYTNQLSKIQEQIEKIEKMYEEYLRLLDNIPKFSNALREEKYNEFQEVVVPLYEIVCNEKQRYLSEKEEVDDMYQNAKKIADDFFYEYYELMCHIVNAEAGTLKCTSMERCYVANVIENRIKSSRFPNTLRGVVYAPNQYSPVSSGSINNTPYNWVRVDMENYLRGRVDTGMPDNVVYQALFTQGSGIWKAMPSGHYFCYL